MENETSGLIIGSIDYREKSKIVHLYTPHGKMSVLAGGSKSLKNNMLGFTTTLNQVDFISTKGNLPRLIEYNLVKSNFDLISSIDKIEAIRIIIKIIQNIPDDANHSKIYSYLIETIDSLYVTNPKKVLSIFLIKMLYAFSINPNLKQCALCGKNEIYSYDIKSGQGYCQEHSVNNYLGSYNIWNEYYSKKTNMNLYKDTDFDKLLSEIFDYYSNYAHIDLKL